MTDADMTDADMDEAEAWVLATFGMGEADFRDRVLTELARLEKFERDQLRRTGVLADARIRRERADAMRGVANIVRAMPLKGDPDI